MRPAFRAALLIGFVGLLNLNTLQSFFVGDDFDYLFWFSRGSSALWSAIHLHFWGEWEPVCYLAWALDQELWGLSPLGFHLQQILWLALLVVALHELLRSLWPAEPFVAWAAALLFAANPLHDEAVAYLAARGHVMCGALSLLALCFYTSSRRPGPLRRRAAALAAALLAAGLAALSKEIALLLPLWAAALEWGVLAEEGRRIRRTLTGAACFLLPVGATLALRAAVVGLGSEKLVAGLDMGPQMLGALAGDLPGYALLSALPLPFGLLGEPALRRFGWLGWLLLAGLALGTIAAGTLLLRRRPSRSTAAGLYLFAVTLWTTSLLPLFWAGLSLRRRYLFLPSAASALVLALALGWLGRRRPRFAALALGLLVVAGAAGTLYRNDLYRRAGSVARGMLETLRGEPLGRRPLEAPGRAALVNLPFRYGGDALSGAYLFHHTDFRSALAVFEAGQPSVEYALRLDHAHDHRAEVISRTDSTLDLRLSFRGRPAFEAALRDDPAAEPRGDAVAASRIAVDGQAREITYRVTVSDEFRGSGGTLYLYSDDRLTPVLP